MGLIKLWKVMRADHVRRKIYRIKPVIRFAVDKTDYVFSLFPTVLFQPWPYRWECSTIIDITWLNIHITFGEWRYR